MSVVEDDLNRRERRRRLVGRQKQPAQEVAIEAEQRNRAGDLIAQLLAPRLESGVALARQPLALVVVVRERLNLDLDGAVPPAEDRFDRLPPGRLPPEL